MIEITSQTDFTTKYIIEANFSIKGVVEKSDIVGAIFGQTEGLLLDLDLRDLQKSGKTFKKLFILHSSNCKGY